MTLTPYVKDLAERVVGAFATSAVGILGANLADVTHLSVWKAAGVAGAIAVLELVRGLGAKPVGNKESAGMTS